MSYDANIQLASLKSRLNITSNREDNLLKELLLDAQETINRIRKFKGTPTRPIEDKYIRLEVKMAAADYAKRGAEGESTHTEGNFSRRFESDGTYPKALLREITPVVGGY